jgi:hypothetical protein
MKKKNHGYKKKNTRLRNDALNWQLYQLQHALGLFFNTLLK